jgi:hypothetical protein
MSIIISNHDFVMPGANFPAIWSIQVLRRFTLPVFLPDFFVAALPAFFAVFRAAVFFDFLFAFLPADCFAAFLAGDFFAPVLVDFLVDFFGAAVLLAGLATGFGERRRLLAGGATAIAIAGSATSPLAVNGIAAGSGSLDFSAGSSASKARLAASVATLAMPFKVSAILSTIDLSSSILASRFKG